MASVFLSYARTDADKARQLARALERAGHDVWWDKRIKGGARYSKEINAALDRAEAVLVLWSKASIASDWVHDEATVGRDKGRLVPIAIADVEPPLGFRQLQTLDLVRWKGRAAPRELLQAIESVVATTSEEDKPEQPPSWWSDRIPRAWLPIAAIAALVALFGIWQFNGSRFMSGSDTPTVAVLPFADLSPEGDKAYFSEGVGEAILSLLSKEPGIKVIGRSSAAQFRPGETDFREIRKALGVTHFIEGSARTAGDQLRMSVRLIDARDGAQVWAEDYQQRLSNIFAVQDEIGRAVAERLKGTLVRAASTARRQTTGADVYTLYLAMRAKMRTRDPRQLREALDLAQSINQTDRAYAPAYAARAELIWLLAVENYGPLPREVALRQAMPHARRAVQLAPDSPEGHAALGLLLMHLDPAAAVKSLSKAIELDPSRAEPWLWRGSANIQLGRKEKAIEDFRRVTEMEPLWGIGLNNLTARLATAGRISEAAALTEQFEKRGGSPAFAAWARGINFYWAGDLSESVRHMLEARRLGLRTPHADEFLASALHLVSLTEAATKQISARQPSHTRLFIAGEREALLAEITKANATVWDWLDDDIAIFALAAARDWEQLRSLYENRRSRRPICPDRAGGAVEAARRAAGSVATNVAQALLATGRREEAVRLLRCVEGQLSIQSGGALREIGFSDAMIAFSRAQILALSGQQDQALRSLEEAINKRWLGLYGGNLGDYPAFDSLPAQEVARIQAKLNSQLARERAEIQQLCPRCE